jgi:hypothetical protein
VGNGDTYEISGYTPDGTLRRILRHSVEPEAADGAQLERLMAPLRQRVGELPANDRPEARRFLERRRTSYQEALASYEKLPAYHDLDVDADGRLWVARIGRDGAHDVFGPNGRLLATLVLPGEPLSFGKNGVIIRQDNELGVPSVSLISLLRPASEDTGRSH